MLTVILSGYDQEFHYSGFIDQTGLVTNDNERLSKYADEGLLMKVRPPVARWPRITVWLIKYLSKNNSVSEIVGNSSCAFSREESPAGDHRL